MVETNVTGGTRCGLSRRTLLSSLFAVAAAPFLGRGARAGEVVARRIVSLDAPSTEMLVLLGIEPVGVAGLDGYRKAEGDIAALREAADIGFFYEPNLELLQALEPDVFVGSFGVGAPRDLLERIAPVFSVPIYGTTTPPFDAARAALASLADATGSQEAGQTFLAAHEARLAEIEAKAAGRALRPVYLATPLLDARHVILYGGNSLFDAVMRRAGLRNAFAGQTSPWGIASVGIDRLAAEPDAAFLFIESPATPAAMEALGQSAIWRSLRFVRDERVFSVPYLEMYGALPTADRFAGEIDRLLDRRVLDAG